MAFVIAFFSLITLIVLHELGHFLLAKKFGVKVEEFGIGYPPRLIGKKIGETVYSLNLLPFGAFVKMQGEIERKEDKRSFSQQSVGKRLLIALGGVFSFWIIAAVLLSIVFTLGAPVVVEEEDSIIQNSEIRIAQVALDSPAERAGLEVGDIIKKLSIGNEEIFPKTIKEIQDFTKAHLGQKITLTIERGENTLDISLIPREFPPKNEGPMGIALLKTAVQKYPLYSAIFKGISATGEITLFIAKGYISAVLNILKGAPTGLQLVGPVGVFNMLNQSQKLGLVYFLNFLALISLHLAIFNILPIPAVDGGKVLFLAIEAVRKKPIPEKVELRITAFSFGILLLLMIWVTIRDVSRLF